jgi:restriction system protein
MTIPDYQTIMLPLLRFLSDGRERSLGEAVEAISAEFHLTPEERQQLLPSGTSTVIGSRVGWARTYMKKAGLIDSTRRGFIRATERGLDVLKRNPERIDNKVLDQFPEFVEFRTLPREEVAAPASSVVEATPEEALEEAYQRLRISIESEVLSRVKTASPAFFERLVVNLLVSRRRMNGSRGSKAGGQNEVHALPGKDEKDPRAFSH